MRKRVLAREGISGEAGWRAPRLMRGPVPVLASPREVRHATKASSKRIQEAAPNAYQLLLNYPASKPPGTREAYRWAHYIAHGAPTIALMHSLYVPEGDAWLVAQRQFYVSGGYNAEQAIAGLFPIQKGTLVFYTNRTSTDQVEGWGGSAKRSIGSRLLASELEALYKKIQAAE